MLHFVCQSTFFTDVVRDGQFGLQGDVRLQGVGEIEFEAFSFAQFIAIINSCTTSV